MNLQKDPVVSGHQARTAENRNQIKLRERERERERENFKETH